MDVLGLLQDFAAWLETLPPAKIIAILMLVAYVENLIPPFPGDVNVVIGGSLVGFGLIDFVPTAILVSLASAMGFMTMYAVGKVLGDAVEDPARLKWIPKTPIRSVKRWLQKWGYGVVLVNRFLSGSRAVITLLAGASDLNPLKTSLLSFLSALAWYSILLSAGSAVGANWETIMPILALYGRVIMGILMAIAGLLVARWWLRTRKRRRVDQRNSEDPAE